MDILFLLASALCLVALSSAVPVYQLAEPQAYQEDLEYTEGSGPIDDITNSASEIYDKNMALREARESYYESKRATCDAPTFGSKWVTVSHSACAVHCLAKGFKGGECKNTVCHCRR